MSRTIAARWRPRTAGMVVAVLGPMKLGVAIAGIVAAVATAGCMAGPEGASSDPPLGKADELSLAETEFRCQVVRVFADHNVLEEGLGSIYEIGPDGESYTDGDSHEVELRHSDDSALDSGMVLGIGQLSIGLHDGNDAIELVDEEPGFDYDFLSVKGLHAASERTFKVRIFTQTQLGYVFVSESAACESDAIGDCEQQCGESTETIEEELTCHDQCAEDAAEHCLDEAELAVLDCRISAPSFE